MPSLTPSLSHVIHDNPAFLGAGWLHYVTDQVPTIEPFSKPRYWVAARGNPTGTGNRFGPKVRPPPDSAPATRAIRTSQVIYSTRVSGLRLFALQPAKDWSRSHHLPAHTHGHRCTSIMQLTGCHTVRCEESNSTSDCNRRARGHTVPTAGIGSSILCGLDNILCGARSLAQYDAVLSISRNQFRSCRVVQVAYLTLSVFYSANNYAGCCERQAIWWCILGDANFICRTELISNSASIPHVMDLDTCQDQCFQSRQS